jgi:hypothetical protein
MNKPQIGRGSKYDPDPVISKGRAVKKAAKKNAEKVPVFIPELKMTVFVLPGIDVGPIISKHKEIREFRLKSVQ